MFSSKEYLTKKTPSGKLNRLEFLQQLVTEFQTSEDQEAQLQVLANLANFAYDPLNYEYMRQLNIVDLFLDMLTEPNEMLVKFGIGGLCNLALDKANKEHILANDGVQLVAQCLSSTTEDTIMSAITTLMFLMTPASKSAITTPYILQHMETLSKGGNKRLSNLAHVFLQDYCTDEQRKALSENVSSKILLLPEHIPLPSGPPPTTSPPCHITPGPPLLPDNPQTDQKQYSSLPGSPT